LLSFDNFKLELDPKTTIIVGPNGAGKSNVLRVLDLVILGLQFAEVHSQDANAVMQSVLETRFCGREGIIRIGLDLAITEDHEKDLITSFMQSAIYTALVGPLAGGPENLAIAQWISREVTSERLTALLQGCLRLTHPEQDDGQWEATYEFSVDGIPYLWHLGFTSLGGVLVRAHRPNPAVHPTIRPLVDRLLGGPQTQPPNAPNGPFSLEALLPVDDEGVQFQAEPRGTPLPTPHRLFASRHGLDPISSNRSYTLGFTFLSVLRRGIIRISDSRLLPGHPALLPANLQGPASDADLPAHLFALKNSPSPTDRARYKRICALFKLLARGRTLDVGHRPPPRQDEPPIARVSASPRFEVPIEFAGSGAWELLLLASTLVQPAGSLLVLDEPGSSLHPTLQRTFLDHVKDQPGQVAIVTHSPYLLPLHPGSGGAALIRIARVGRASKRWRITPQALGSMAPKLVAKGNPGIPFAERVVLCEGQVDVAVISVVAERLSLRVAEANVLVVDCGGRDSIPAYIAFCAALGISLLTVMDGDASKALIDPSVRDKAQAVVDAVHDARGVAKLVAFSEDVERAFGLQRKNRAALLRAANNVRLDVGEPGDLALALKSFLRRR
jgi:energy-coupling factor transporter ATP-binding protein EcfA2